MNKLVFVYVVKCCVSPTILGYYIGTWGGDNVNFRLSEHFRGRGSNFTKKYPPISSICVGRFEKGVASRLENLLTAYYMKKVGFRYCRGGNHLNMRPNCHQISQLKWWVPGGLLPLLYSGALGTPDLAPEIF